MNISFLDRNWRWNQEDVKLAQVNDWVKDLNTALEVVNDAFLTTAIQAGGAMGVWPWVMGGHFHTVHTFEPVRENYACLLENVMDRENVVPHFGALSDHEGYCDVKLPPEEHSNAGAYYIAPDLNSRDMGAPMYTIDTLVQNQTIKGKVSLIQLDVEGFELKALQGAQKTIERFRPVIMVEDKPLPQDAETGHIVGAVERWLIDVMGYTLHRKVHRDLVFVSPPSKPIICPDL